MKFISKIKEKIGGFFTKKQEDDPYDCEGKSLEWFNSENGKISYNQTIKNHKFMLGYISETPDFWGKISCVNDVCNYNKSWQEWPEEQYNWPCRYFYHFIEAYKKENKILFTLTGETARNILIYVFLGGTDDEKPLQWPQCIDKEKNPMLNCFLSFTDSEKCLLLAEKYLLDIITYVNDVYYEKNVDASLEEWIYNENTYFKGQYRRNEKTVDEVHEVMITHAKYPEIMKASLK